MFGANKGYTIKNIINLEKIIGSDSYNSKIYKTSIINSFGAFSIATKIMKNNIENNYEVSLMNNITNDIIINKRSKHFPIMYKSCLCERKDYPINNVLICVNETANGDLTTLLNNHIIINDKNILFNILFQTFISIGTFHNYLNHIHNDCHGGNFLWNYNNEKGYYHYIFNNEDFYLKACGYNIMIYDYGYSNIIKSKRSIIQLRTDYATCLYVFLNDEIGLISKGLTDPHDDIVKELKEIIQLFMKKRKVLASKYNMVSSSSKSNPINNKKELFQYIIDNIFNVYSPTDMFITTYRPKNIINKMPFYIDK